jgi:hemoglobin-like flavoprotein
MEPQDIERLRDSWSLVEERADDLAEAFYARLFELDPALRDLFAATDMEIQAQKFLAMMTEIVRVVDDSGQLVPALRDSGRRHRGYGVVSRDYLTVGEAFLGAMERVLGPEFDDATRDAWAEAYTQVATVMQNGAGAASAGD